MDLLGPHSPLSSYLTESHTHAQNTHADIILISLLSSFQSRKSFVVPFLICGTIYWIFWVLEFGYDVYRINHPKTPMTDEDELKAVAEAIGDFIAIGKL